jgi:hypothetical protein
LPLCIAIGLFVKCAPADEFPVSDEVLIKDRQGNVLFDKKWFDNAQDEERRGPGGAGDVNSDGSIGGDVLWNPPAGLAENHIAVHR